MKYWKRINVLGETTTVESYSYDLPVEGAIEIDEQEYNDYLASLPPPPPPVPPISSHISTLVSVDVAKARPAKVKRVWNGHDYLYDCFVTQTVKNEYQAGSIQIGDFLLVHFDDTGEQVVTAKVFKSWA